jgi:hypothetical protein
VADVGVRVETTELDARGNRQISSRTRSSALLSDRAGDVRDAIVQASDIAQQALRQTPDREGWEVSSAQITFGLTLVAEAGVILSKASAEASIEVTLTVERTAGAP